MPDRAYDSPEFHELGPGSLAMRNASWGGCFARLEIRKDLSAPDPHFESFLTSLGLRKCAGLKAIESEYRH